MAHSTVAHARHLATPVATVALVLVVAGCALTSTASSDPTVQATSTAAESGPPATPAPAPRSATVDEIEGLQAAIDADPSDPDAQRDLGFALLQRVRETADPSLYALAEAAFERARSLAPDDALVLVGIGSLQLGKHDFAAALETAGRAIEMAPRSAVARAVEVDALVELGRYDEADEAAAAMLGLGSDLTTLSRVSYLAELHGQLEVAVTGMRAATKSEGVAPENLAFTHVQLGNLLVYSGDPRPRRRSMTAPLSLSQAMPRPLPARVASRSVPAVSTKRSTASSKPPMSCRCPST